MESSHFALVANATICTFYSKSVLQRNLNKIESNVAELEAKLKHEQEKFKTYHKDLKEAEKRYALHVRRPCVVQLGCAPSQTASADTCLACFHLIDALLEEHLP